jgi:hypothetical protein
VAVDRPSFMESLCAHPRRVSLAAFTCLALLLSAAPLEVEARLATIADCPPGEPCRTPAMPGDPSTKVLGDSTQGRPIPAYRFGSGASTRAILAGIHAGYEWNTVGLAEALVAHLWEHPEEIPSDVTLWIVPVVNPDGYARGHGSAGRANANGVDVNRNFPALWLADWPRAGCWDLRPISAGEAPASEPETLAVMSFLLSEHVEAVVSYHSAALGIFAGGQPTDPRSGQLAQALSAASGYAYPPLDAGCAYTGQLIDWAAANGIAAVDVELTTHYRLDLEQNLALLEAFLEWSPSELGSASSAP